MPTNLETVQFTFSDVTGHEYTDSESLGASGQVIAAETAIKSFEIGFEGNDRELMSEKIQTDADVHGDTISVNLEALFRDASGHIDDPYGGNVEVLVITENE
ncbi:hypothetical protein C499_07290 [Halogeometricum borinquense DSM 11551]|uniref:Uncharacterized protein n=1 Tax=Halogeometricum borinquense (strain ATCC 700274 / DSM 11551 / JCM 10706 / KCTC 4070 / PR3) TaxID=469382 RepID=E4NVG9_HALBP|nr:hypothetical protein [Halogeometricum borinquense]ADQ68853.1 hypothetical protein Hbor_33290 [Halogeometricum borinquense DSM 11551]ELY28718.1 hypothetical protein C499_07290 [Halogeometricum borinquense DSM 11551]